MSALEITGTALENCMDLALLEEIVETGKRHWVRAGLALWQIKRNQLYAEHYPTWEEYCQERWGFGRRYANRLVVGSEVAVEMVEHGVDVPSEKHARALAQLDTPEERAEALEHARALAGGAPGARQLQAVVDATLGKGKDKDKPPSKQARRTPPWLVDALQEIFFPFMCDAYASSQNAICEKHFTREQDGNKQNWPDGTFWNPEFRDMALPVGKAVAEQAKGNHSLGIGPVGGSQSWFHTLAIQGTVYSPNVRINFDDEQGKTTGQPGDGEKGADRDHIIMVFGGEWKNATTRVAAGQFRFNTLDLKKYVPRR